MTRIVNGTKMARWTPSEEEQLVELSKTNVSYQEIAQRLNRTYSSIINKVQNERGVLHIPSRQRGRRID